MDIIFKHKGKEYCNHVEKKLDKNGNVYYVVTEKKVDYYIRNVQLTKNKKATHLVWSRSISYRDGDTFPRLSPQEDSGFISYLMSAVEEFMRVNHLI